MRPHALGPFLLMDGDGGWRGGVGALETRVHESITGDCRGRSTVTRKLAMNFIVNAAAMTSAATTVSASPIGKPSADAALLEMEEKIFQHKEAAEAIYPEMNRLGAIWHGEMRRLYEAAVVAGNVVETEVSATRRLAPCRNVLSTSD